MYENIKFKAQTLLGEVDKNTNINQLSDKLKQELPKFDKTATLEQNQASIKALIDMSTELSNVFNNVYQEDFNHKAQAQTSTLTNLQNQQKTLETTVNELKQNQATFASTLNNNVNIIISQYKSLKTLADKVKTQAKSYQINTSDLDKLLNLQDLPTPKNINEQINYIKQYTDRINKLTSETTKFNKMIVVQVEKQNNNNKSEINKLKNKITQQAQEISFLKSKTPQLSPNHPDNFVLKKQLEQEQDKNKLLTKQIKDVKKELNDKISKLKEFKDVILNSSVYQQATNPEDYNYVYPNEKSPYTGYSNLFKDKENYGEYYTELNSETHWFKNEKPSDVSVINQIKLVAPVFPPEQMPDIMSTSFDVKIAYIDKEHPDTVLYKQETIESDLANSEYGQLILLSEHSENVSGWYMEVKEFVLVKHVGTDKDNQYEFTNVVASDTFDTNALMADDDHSWLRPFSKRPVLSSKTPMISVQIINN
ncbi:hypothetical protein [Mycoplasma sp. 3686d]|uniref:hypothetical protein n=1 Tax=Mycoplasma sp. 3686d TaxID=2967300 RepID=UPI00211C6B75|nr:hypothetical protein [Mycoplasma sp. 3686d]UUM24558.1 hypothetical protein NPA12_02550 [Mycoplasma sp. 3686d]